MSDLFSDRIREHLRKGHPSRDAWWHRNSSAVLGFIACFAAVVFLMGVVGIIMTAGHP